MKKNVISTITKSLPIEFSSLVNYSLLVTLCYINLFYKKTNKLLVCGFIKSKYLLKKYLFKYLTIIFLCCVSYFDMHWQYMIMKNWVVKLILTS